MFLTSHMYYVPCLSHSPWFDYLNIWQIVQIMKLLINAVLSSLLWLLSLRPKCSSQHPYLKNPQPID
jgi:hypothetical protein